MVSTAHPLLFTTMSVPLSQRSPTCPEESISQVSRPYESQEDDIYGECRGEEQPLSHTPDHFSSSDQRPSHTKGGEGIVKRVDESDPSAANAFLKVCTEE
jgi:hypothetical protein